MSETAGFSFESKYARVCEKHFDASDIVRADVCTVNGDIVSLPRERPRLVEDAVPRIFEGLPSYLSKPKQRSRATKGPPLKRPRELSPDCDATVANADVSSAADKEIEDVVRTENRNGYADAECQTEVTVCSASELQRVKAQLRSVKQQLQSCVLMFDEMSVRKSLHVRESDMALLGKVDLAEHTKPTDQVKDGDHVLVFLFRPFLGGWSQTVGAFCTSGAAPGSTVAKLILQCIVLLSNAGVIVEAVTCDNSTSNRSALNSLGVSGDVTRVSTSFEHPCDSSKVIQAIIDPPHIFKCIRNNLLKAGKFLLPGDKEVQHSHFEALLDYEEQQAGLRAVPKLTKAHISPNAFQKLSVRLAVQIDTLAVLFDDILLEPAECMQDMIHPESTRDCILDYLGGYVAKKFAKISCKDCLQTLRSNSREPTALTQIKTRGFLQVPSEKLLRLLQIVEEHVEMCTVDKIACASVYMNIVENILLDDRTSSASVGCGSHFVSTTAEVVHFFIKCRLHFFTREQNKLFRAGGRRLSCPAKGGRKPGT
ncbi:hypothetical protein HPB51_026011 [Rhipicephalus microplus]|uniref:Transposable element n=1 Tax=Rhipicephalus microplus TaxID=6941 RepID=A0A9J6EDW6_RHIMP|nr:hypothetical protein HPB51_026011 [Rhipicephalus microplus]